MRKRRVSVRRELEQLSELTAWAYIEDTMGYILIGLAKTIDMLLSLYFFVVIISAVISWVGPDPYNPIVRFLTSVTEPVYARIRRIIPLRVGYVDLSPIIVIAIIYFLKYALVMNLIRWGAGFR